MSLVTMHRRYSEVRGRRLSVWEAAGEAFEASPVGDWMFSHVINRIDKCLLPLTKGRSFSLARQNIALLTTTGAKSGQLRTTPLQFVADGERVLLVASAGGAAKDPAWAHNLRRHAACALLYRGVDRRFTARQVTGDERARSWARAVDWYQGYAQYQTRTTREIPVFILEPTAVASHS
jgi:F420H(2)-dependent quinone reductase